MLQPADIQRFEWLKKQVQRLGIRFPVAEIAEKTGFDQGNISSYLKGKKPISDNFFTKFKKAYDIDSVENGDPSTKEILMVMAEAFKAQAEMMRNIESKMAREDTQATIDTKMSLVLETLRTVAARQEADEGVILESLERLEGDPKRKLFQDAGKRKSQIEKDAGEFGKMPA